MLKDKTPLEEENKDIEKEVIETPLNDEEKVNEEVANEETSLEEPIKEEKTSSDIIYNKNNPINYVLSPEETDSGLSQEKEDEMTRVLLEENNKKNPKGKKIKLKYRTRENDIHYQGPLSYRYIRLIAWIFLALTQVGTALTTYKTWNNVPDGGMLDRVINISNFFSAFPLVLFLLANFGIILRNRKNFRYLFIFYGGMALGLYILGNFVVLHYVYGLAKALNPEASLQNVTLATGIFLESIGHNGYIFNLFIDLFLCVLTVYFLFYTPKSKYYEGKKIVFFRALVILPVIYEIVSLVLKHSFELGKIQIPSYFFFLLTSKPTFTFLAFFAVTIIIKVREYRFLKKFDNNEEMLRDHESTNAHSLRTSITISFVFLIVAFLDILAFVLYVVIQTVKFGDIEYIDYAVSMAENIGLGGSISLIPIIPFVILYSYTRVHKNKKLDSFLPIIGVGLVIITLLESTFLVIVSTISKGTASLYELEQTIEETSSMFRSFISH